MAENMKTKNKKSVTFKAFITRADINDCFWPRTFLTEEKPLREQIWYWGVPHKGCDWETTQNGRLASYKLKELLPDLKYEDEPVEVEVTVKILDI